MSRWTTFEKTNTLNWFSKKIISIGSIFGRRGWNILRIVKRGWIQVWGIISRQITKGPFIYFKLHFRIAFNRNIQILTLARDQDLIYRDLIHYECAQDDFWQAHTQTHDEIMAPRTGWQNIHFWQNFHFFQKWLFVISDFVIFQLITLTSDDLGNDFELLKRTIIFKYGF